MNLMIKNNESIFKKRTNNFYHQETLSSNNLDISYTKKWY